MMRLFVLYAMKTCKKDAPSSRFNAVTFITKTASTNGYRPGTPAQTVAIELQILETLKCRFDLYFNKPCSLV